MKTLNEKFLELTLKKNPMEIVFFDSSGNSFLPKDLFLGDKNHYKIESFCEKYIKENFIEKVMHGYNSSLSGNDSLIDLELKKNGQYSLYIKSVNPNGAFFYFLQKRNFYNILDGFLAVIIDENDLIKYSSTTFLSAVGMVNKQLIDLNIFDIFPDINILDGSSVKIKKKSGGDFYANVTITNFNNLKIVSFQPLFDNPKFESILQFIKDDSIMQKCPISYVIIDGFGKIEWFNQKFLNEIAPIGEKIYQRMIGSWLKCNEREKFTENIEKLNTSFKMYYKQNVYEVYTQDSFIENDKKFYLVAFKDITSEFKREKQIINSQNLQVLGKIATMISHDFNNLLTGIGGMCDLLLIANKDQKITTELSNIRENTNKAAKLVNQILSFSKQNQEKQYENFSIYTQIKSNQPLLQRIIGGKISLEISMMDNDPRVVFDKSQFDQILINLVVNAKDAIQNSGKISIIVKDKIVSHTVERTEIPKGNYKSFSVTDNGCGMNSNTIKKIFTPFFSTKGDKGTGLGLATIKEILLENGGYIMVESEISKGSKFTVLLSDKIEKNSPQKNLNEELFKQVNSNYKDISNLNNLGTFNKKVINDNNYQDMNEISSLKFTEKSFDKIDNIDYGNNEIDQLINSNKFSEKELNYQKNDINHDLDNQKPFIDNNLEINNKKFFTNKSENINLSSIKILLVDDDDTVRNFSFKAIQQNITQYVYEVNNPISAINLSKMQEFDLIISDVEMNEMNGPEMVNKIKKIQPNIKVLFLSGYNSDYIKFSKKYDFKFLSKPFGIKDLINSIKEVSEI